MKAVAMKKLSRLAAVAALTVAAAAAQATPVVVDVTGAQSVNLLGETGNTVWLVNVGANALINSLDWSVVLNAVSPSSLSDMQVSFGSSSGLDMLDFRPGSLDTVPGTGSYSGTLDLTGLGLATGADGLLRIEFSEAYKDLAVGAVEGQWLSGALTFDVSAVPEPASAALALMGLGLVGAHVRRRQSR